MITQDNYLKKIFPLAVGIIFGSLLVARLLWPSTSPLYDDLWQTISGLGDMDENPIGFIFFQISMTVVGLLIIPSLLYIHPRLTAFKKIWTFFGSFWLLLGALGFILTGLIPDDTLPINKFHEITSGLGFVGVLLAAMFYGLTIISTKPPYNKKLHLGIALMWWISIICAGVGFAIAELIIKQQYNLGWYNHEWALAGITPLVSFSVWERVLFTVAIAYLGLMVKLIPENAP